MNQDQIEIFTLGKFQIDFHDRSIGHKDWGRDKTLQLFQYLIISRNRSSQHKEQIIDRIWPESNNGESDFKVALHGINKVLDPNKKKRSDSKYIIREGTSYRLNFSNIVLDVDLFDQKIESAYRSIKTDLTSAQQNLYDAIDIYKGGFLPNRIYDDWTSSERERLQLDAMNASLALAELLFEENPNESIRLAQTVITVDHTWEEAYQVIIKAYLKKGNRTQAIKTYQNCSDILETEYGIAPLPETKAILGKLLAQ